MAVDGVTGRILGIDEAVRALKEVVPKLRQRAIRNALAAGARVFRDEAKRLTPVIAVAVRRRGQVIRKPGTVRNAISVRTSKNARRAGDVGVFVNVRPAKNATFSKGAQTGAKTKGAFSPDDPFYWRWLEFGRSSRGVAAARVRVARNKKAGIKGVRYRRLLSAVGGIRPYRFLQGAVGKSAQALSTIIAALGPAIQKLNNKGGQK